MDARLAIALCLPLMLLHVQVDGQPIVPAFKDVDDTLANLDENPSITPDPSALSPASQFEPDVQPAPMAEPSSGFEVQMNQGMAQCRRETRLPGCSWRKGFIVVSQGLVVQQEVSDDICCCACHRVDDCQAIHYERREGRCVFHEGPITGDQRQSGSKRWLK